MDAPKFAEALREKKQAPYCSICNREEPRCSPHARAVICWRCCCNATELPPKYREETPHDDAAGSSP